MVEYTYLTAAQRAHFLTHGWLLIPNSIPKAHTDAWLADVWDRLGYDEHDPATWTEEVVFMPRHREMMHKDFSPDAWRAMCELVGGEDRIDHEREIWSGDQFVCNFGTEYWRTHEIQPREAPNWHIDGDWFRHFLDSGENGLVVIQVFTDIPPRGGGTYVCEDGIPGLCKFLYEHPDGLVPPIDRACYAHIPECEVFAELTAKAGDTVLLHPFLPHTQSKNNLRNKRIITNAHVNLKSPLNLNRPNPADYSLVEQLVLNALHTLSPPLSPTTWQPTHPREHYYPRNYDAKYARVEGELRRMIEAAEKKGLGREAVDSVYLKGEEAIREHNKRNGLTLPKIVTA